MLNNDFVIHVLIKIVHYSAKLQIVKIHKNVQKLTVICARRVGSSNFYLRSISLNSHRTVFTFRSWLDLLGFVLAFWISIRKISILLQNC